MPKNCVVCGKMFVPDPSIVAKTIYCSPKCAWNTDSSRSRESLMRERDALDEALSKTRPN